MLGEGDDVDIGGRGVDDKRYHHRGARGGGGIRLVVFVCLLCLYKGNPLGGLV